MFLKYTWFFEKETHTSSFVNWITFRKCINWKIKAHIPVNSIPWRGYHLKSNFLRFSTKIEIQYFWNNLHTFDVRNLRNCVNPLKFGFGVLRVQIKVDSSPVDKFRIVAADTSHKNSFREESRILLNITNSFSIQKRSSTGTNWIPDK